MTEDMHEERLHAAEAFGNAIGLSGQLERDILSSGKIFWDSMALHLLHDVLFLIISRVYLQKFSLLPLIYEQWL